MILPLLACLTLVGASSAPLAVSSLPFGNEPLPQCAVYDDVNDSITFESGDFNYVIGWDDSNQSYILTTSYPTLSNLGSYLFENVSSSSMVGSTLSIGDVEYSYSDYNEDDVTRHALYWTNNSVVYTDFSCFFTEDICYFRLADPDDNDGSFSSFTINFSNSTLYEGAKTALQTDLQGMSGVEVVNEIVDILAGGLTSLGLSLGGAIATFAQSLAFQDGELSVYFVLIVVFAGVSLAIGLTTLLFNWLTNLGK